MKTTIDLPDDLVTELKLRAVLQHRTLKELVAELLRQTLHGSSSKGSESSTSSLVLISKDGLPLIQCASDAPATRTTAEELLKLEQETQFEEDSQRASSSL